jgi:hypothetical protein
MLKKAIRQTTAFAIKIITESFKNKCPVVSRAQGKVFGSGLKST